MHRNAKIALATSFVAISSCGAVAVYGHWKHKGFLGFGFALTAVYVVVMALVHLLAFWLYRDQRVSGVVNVGPMSDSLADNTEPVRRSFTFWIVAPEFGSAIKSALIQQSAGIVLGALALDNGGMFANCAIAVLAHWAAITAILLRRPMLPTKTDTLTVRYGYFPLVAFGLLVTTVSLASAYAHRWPFV